MLEIATHWKEVKRWAADAWNSVASALKPVWSMIKDVYTWMKWLVDHVGNLFSGKGGGEAGRQAAIAAGGPVSPRVGLPPSFGTSMRNPVPATQHRAGADQGQPIVLHNVIQLDGRTVAENMVHHVLRRTALG